MSADMWGYPETAGFVPGAQLVGFHVEATDGSIGKVDKQTENVDRSYIVVDTGPWIFGRRVLLPAGLVTRIDTETETVRVSCTKDEVKDSPDYESGGHGPESDNTFIQLIEQYYVHRRS